MSDTKSKEKSHDKLVKKLEQILLSSGQYYIIQANVQYGTSAKTLGEIDVLAIGSDIFDIYEVKGSAEQNSMRKAVDQVRMARRYLGQTGSEFIYTPHYGIETLDQVVHKLQQRKADRRR